MGNEISSGGSDSQLGSTIPSCATTTQPPPSPPPPPPISIRASVFFDGTGNNRANTASRVEGTSRGWRASVPGRGDSYGNDNSNIEKLERFLQADSSVDHFFKIYVAGIGTVSLDGDNLIGLATGMGESGVKARVEGCLSAVVSQIRSLVSNPASPLIIYLDAFGFSRGAAAARYYCYQVMVHEEALNLRAQLTSAGFTISNIQIKFVGLFDTVASFGANHANDTSDLHLTAITFASQVVHLASADEHRINFPLTNIHSKGSIEIFLPGVHSDIGGGYRDMSSEDGLVVYKLVPSIVTEHDFEKVLEEKTRLVASGWYSEDQLSQSRFFPLNLVANKSGILSDYSLIPLRIMASFALEKSLTFGNLEARCPLPAALNSTFTRLQTYCNQKRGGGSSASDWHGNSPELMNLRFRYFHNSAYYDTIGSMNPQFYSTLYQWADSSDNRKLGRRRRIEYSG